MMRKSEKNTNIFGQPCQSPETGFSRLAPLGEFSNYAGMAHISTTIALIAITLAEASAADLVVPENVRFEKNIDFANPDDQHLQLDLATPSEGSGAFPAVLCIHGGGFRAGTRDG